MAAGDCNIHLIQTCVCQSADSFLYLRIFFLQVFAFLVPGGTKEQPLNDPGWCSQGCMWATGVSAMGAGAEAGLHSTSLGPGLPSWSHIKEQPCLSTCAGWSPPSAFPLRWRSRSHFGFIHTCTKNIRRDKGMMRGRMGKANKGGAAGGEQGEGL